jgi:hypothetical protein
LTGPIRSSVKVLRGNLGAAGTDRGEKKLLETQQFFQLRNAGSSTLFTGTNLP